VLEATNACFMRRTRRAETGFFRRFLELVLDFFFVLADRVLVDLLEVLLFEEVDLGWLEDGGDDEDWATRTDFGSPMAMSIARSVAIAVAERPTKLTLPTA
jgi:hypothetical protein